MKVLWIIRNSMPFVYPDSEFRRTFENVIGKDNVVFYTIPNLPTHDESQMSYYPENPKIVSLFPEQVKEEKPDVIVNDGLYMNDIGHMTDIPKITFINDVHAEWQNRKYRFLNKEFDVLFLRMYGGGVGIRAKQEFGGTVGYCPRSVPTDMFYNQHFERTIDVFLAGCYNIIYPIRVAMWKWLFNNGFNGKTVGTLKVIINAKRFLYPEYLNILCVSKITAFDGGLFKFPVMKYWESMATESLCLADLPLDYKALGLVPNENMVEINMYNFMDKWKYYLENDEERKRITRNGLNLILQKHSDKCRAKQLLVQLEEVINSKNEGRKFDPNNVKEMRDIFSMLEEKENNIFNPNNLLNRCMNEGQCAYTKWDRNSITIWNEILNNTNWNESIKRWDDYIKQYI
jgi:hypothetical protein